MPAIPQKGSPILPWARSAEERLNGTRINFGWGLVAKSSQAGGITVGVDPSAMGGRVVPVSITSSDGGEAGPPSTWTYACQSLVDDRAWSAVEVKSPRDPALQYEPLPEGSWALLVEQWNGSGGSGGSGGWVPGLIAAEYPQTTTDCPAE